MQRVRRPLAQCNRLDDEVKGGSGRAAVGEATAWTQARAIATAPTSPSQLVRPCLEGRMALPS